MQAAAHGIGLHANSDQIVAFKTVQSLFPTDSHPLILRVFAKKNLWRGMGVFSGGFAISTVFHDGKTW
jgi:hypothetical protein